MIFGKATRVKLLLVLRAVRSFDSQEVANYEGKDLCVQPDGFLPRSLR